MSDYHNFYLKKAGNKYFCHFSPVINENHQFFSYFRSFAPSACWCSHPHIEPKHGFDWGV